MKRNYTHLFWLLALGVAVSFDQFFWGKSWGINFFIFVLLTVLGGLIPIWLEKIKIPWTSYLLLIPVAGFAIMTFLRAEPLTNVMNALITLGSLILFAISLLNGAWIRFNILDHLKYLVKFILNCFSGGVLFFIRIHQDMKESKKTAGEGKEQSNNRITGDGNKKRKIRKFVPYLRGIALALPILFVLIMLLMSADPVFKTRVQHLFSWFDPDDLGEYLFRLVYIAILAYLLLSAYFFGLVESIKLEKTEASKLPLRPFLGTIEASIILVAVNLLFLVFVIMQFTYLFGGETNIAKEGFTFAEYARRGYFELLAVVVITLIMLYILSLITKRKTKTQRWTFSGLGLALVALTGVILASGYTRLSLYEAAYGFTRLRIMTHISMIWIGLLLLAIIILEVNRKMECLAIFLICLIFSFGLTINLVNIDRYIVQENISRVLSITEDNPLTELDAGYLHSLSYDSIPPLVSFFNDPAIPRSIHDEIGGILACRLVSFDGSENQPWTSTHFSRSKAVRILKENADALDKFLFYEDSEWFVKINGERRPCRDYATDAMFPD